MALLVLLLAAVLLVRQPPDVTAQSSIDVKASLESCDKVADGDRTCSFSVSFDNLAAASGYEVTISSPAGVPLLTTPALPAGDSYTVPYSGNGTYGIKVIALG